MKRKKHKTNLYKKIKTTSNTRLLELVILKNYNIIQRQNP